MVFTIADILNQWQQIGVFNIMFPWLLIFGVVFGILNTTRVFGKHKGIYALIAIVIAFLSLQSNYLGDFLTELAPRLGVGITVILTMLILVGLFIPDDERRYWLWGLGAIGAVIALIVIMRSFDTVSWGWGSGYWDQYVGYIVGAVLLVGLIIAVAAGGNEKSSDKGVAVLKPWTKD